MGRHGLHVFAFVVCFAAASALAGPPVPGALTGKAGKNPYDLKDAWGRPIPWGEEVKGKRLSLSLPRTDLRFGQPVEFFALTLNPTGRAPYLSLRLTGTDRKATLRLTDRAGKGVPFEVQVSAQGESVARSWVGGAIVPKGSAARGRYLKPGEYRLQLVVEAPRDGRYAKAWVGTLGSNVVTFSVREVGDDRKLDPAAAAFRRKAQALIRQLDDEAFAAREKATAELSAPELGPQVLTLLGRAAASGSPEQRRRARRALDAIFGRVVQQLERVSLDLERQIGPYICDLPDSEWRRLHPKLARMLLSGVVAPARYAPVPRLLDPAKPDDKRLLLEGFRDKDPARRILAARAVASTDDGDVLNALVGLLADPFGAWVTPHRVPGMPSKRYPVGGEAAATLRLQGKAAVEPLVRLVRAKIRGKPSLQQDRQRLFAWGSLQAVGPDPRTLAYAKELLQSKERGEPRLVCGLLASQGELAVPFLRRMAADPKLGLEWRFRMARLLGARADPKVAQPLVLQMLKSEDWSTFDAAAKLAVELKLADTLPAFERFACDEARNQNPRYYAMRAVVQLAPRDRAERLLRKLARPGVHGGVRGTALLHLARLGCVAAVPVLLDSLEADDWIVRAQADAAMRVMTRRPEGVGFNGRTHKPEARRAEAAKWRKAWADFQAQRQGRPAPPARPPRSGAMPCLLRSCCAFAFVVAASSLACRRGVASRAACRTTPPQAGSGRLPQQELLRRSLRPGDPPVGDALAAVGAVPVAVDHVHLVAVAPRLDQQARPKART